MMVTSDAARVKKKSGFLQRVKTKSAGPDRQVRESREGYLSEYLTQRNLQ